MEQILSPKDQQSMVSSFLEIAEGQTAQTARQFLQATSWTLEEAIQLFLINNEAAAVPLPSSSHHWPVENVDSWPQPSSVLGKDATIKSHSYNDGDYVRPPLPVKRETLYDDAMLYGASRIELHNFEEEMRRPSVWESEQGAVSTSESSRDNLASLYRPPFHLMFDGPFDKAYDDTTEGRKVCTYYKLDSVPAVLIIDPITGQMMRSWVGMIQPESLLDGLLPFLDAGPKHHHITLPHKRHRESSSLPETKDEKNRQDEEIARALAAYMESMKESTAMAVEENDSNIPVNGQETDLRKRPIFPPLPEERKGDKNLQCRVGVRLPNGRRVQRNFLRADPIQLLWSFCSTLLGEDETKPFQFTQAIPGASKTLDYENKSTFEESGIANSMISLTWN